MATTNLENQIRISINVLAENAEASLTNLVNKFAVAQTSIEVAINSIGASIANLNKATKAIEAPKSISKFITELDKFSKISGNFPDLTKLAAGLKAFDGISAAPKAGEWTKFLRSLSNVQVPNLAKLVSDINSLGNAFQKLTNASPVVQSLIQIGSTAQRVSQSIGQLDIAARNNITTWDKFAQKIQNYSAYRLISQGVMMLQSAFGGGITEIIGYSQALQDLQAITLATDGDVQRMGEKIKEVASLTKFSTVEVAEGMKILAQAGLSASDSIDAMQAVADLATGTLSDMSQSVDLITTAMSVFKIEAKDSAMIADTFANAVNKSKLTIEKLRTAFNYVGPIAAEAGISFQDVNAALGVLANNGLRASTMGTGLRKMISELVDPNEKLAAAAAKVGISLSEIDPTTNKFSNVVKSLGVILQDTQTAFDIFGERAASAALALTDSSQGYDKMLKDVEASGTAAKMAAIQMEGLGISFKNLQDKLKLVAVAIGEAGLIDGMKIFVDLLRGLADVLTSIINNAFAQFVAKSILMSGAIGIAAKGVMALVGAMRALTAIKVIAFLQSFSSTAAQAAAVFAGTASSITAGSAAAGAAAVNVGVLSRAFQALKLVIAQTGIGLIVLAIGAAVTAFIQWRSSIANTIEELQNEEQQHKDNVAAIEGHSKSIEELSKKQEELSQIDFASKQAEIVSALIKQYPEYTAKIVAASGSLKDLQGALGDIKSTEATKGMVTLRQEVEAITESIKSLENRSLSEIFTFDTGKLQEFDAKRMKEYGDKVAQVAAKVKELADAGQKVDLDQLIPIDKMDGKIDPVREQIVKFVADVKAQAELLKEADLVGALASSSGKSIEYFKSNFVSIGEIVNNTSESFRSIGEYFNTFTDEQKAAMISQSLAVKDLLDQVKKAEDAYKSLGDSATDDQAKAHIEKMKVFEDQMKQLLKDSNVNLDQIQRMAVEARTAEEQKAEANKIKDALARNAKLEAIETNFQQKLKVIREMPIAIPDLVIKYKEQYQTVEELAKSTSVRMEKMAIEGALTEEQATRNKLRIALTAAQQQAQLSANLFKNYETAEQYSLTKSKEYYEAKKKAAEDALGVEQAKVEILKNTQAEAIKDIAEATKQAQTERKGALEATYLQIAQLEARGVITSQESERKKLSASRAYYIELVSIAKAELAKLEGLGFKAGDTEYDKAFEAVTNAVTEQAKTIADQLEEVNKKTEEYAEKYKKLRLDMADEGTENVDKEKEITQKRLDDRLEQEKKAADDLAEIEQDLADKKEEIGKDLNKKLEDLSRDRTEIEQNAAADIAGIEDTTEEKIRGIRQKGMSDRKKRVDDERAAYALLQEGIQAVEKARAEGDKAALERGKGLIEQASSLFEKFEKPAKAIAGLEQVGEAQKKAIEAGKDIDLKENARKEKEAQDEAKDKLDKAQTEYDRKKVLIDKEKQDQFEKIQKVYEKESLEEDKRHEKKMRNYQLEYAELMKQITANATNQRDIQNATTGVGTTNAQSNTQAAPKVIATPTVDNASAEITIKKWDEVAQKFVEVKKIVEGNPIIVDPANQTGASIEAVTQKVEGAGEAVKNYAKVVSENGQSTFTNVGIDETKTKVQEATNLVVDFNKETGKVTLGNFNNPITQENVNSAIAKLRELKTELTSTSQEGSKENTIQLKAQTNFEEAKQNVISLVGEMNTNLGAINSIDPLPQVYIDQAKVNIQEVTDKMKAMFSSVDTVDMQAQVVSAAEAFNQVSAAGLASDSVIADMMTQLQTFADTAKTPINFTWTADGTLVAQATELTGEQIDALRTKAESPFIFGVNDQEVVRVAESVPAIMEQMAIDAKNKATIEINAEKLNTQIEEAKTNIQSIQTDEKSQVEIPLKLDDQKLEEEKGVIEKVLEDFVADPIEKEAIVLFKGSGSETLPISEKIGAIKEELATINELELVLTLNIDTTKLDDLNATIEAMKETGITITLTVVGQDVWDTVKKTYDALVDKIISLTLNIKGIETWQQAYSLYSKLQNKTVTITTIHRTVEKKEAGGEVGKFADGGKVFRKLTSRKINKGSGTSDDVPALLMRGEYVMRKSAVAKYGSKFMDLLNRGLLDLSGAFPSKYEAGGIVQSLSDKAFMVGRSAQLAVNPTAPFKKDGITYNINAPTFHQNIQEKADKLRSFKGKSSASKLIKSFSKLVPRFQGGGSAIGGFEQEKQALIASYNEDIRFAKASGADEVAFLLESEKLALEELANELAFTLEQIRVEYEQNMLKAKLELEESKMEIEEERIDARNDYDGAMLDLKKEKMDIERKFIDEKKKLSDELAKAQADYEKKSRGSVGKYPQYTKYSVDEASAKVNDLQYRLGRLEEDYQSDSTHVKEKEEFEGTKLGRKETVLKRKEGFANTKHDGEVKLIEQETVFENTKGKMQNEMEIKKTQHKTKFDVLKSERETAHEVKKLELELQMALIELRKKYEDLANDASGGQAPQLGIKYWLNKGGYVGWTKGAKKRKDSIPAMLTPGEFVVTQDAVDKYGKDFMESLNKREVDPDYNAFPSFLDAPKMINRPATINGTTFHVNAPSFHNNLAARTAKTFTPIGKQAGKRMVDIFSLAIPKMAAGGGIGDAQQQLDIEKNLVTQEYKERIRYAKATGQEDLAYILQAEQDELLMIAEELRFTLEELQMEYDFALQEAKLAYDEAMLENQLELEEALIDIEQERLDAKNDLEQRILEYQQKIADAKDALAGAGAGAGIEKEKILQDIQTWADQRFSYWYNGANRSGYMHFGNEPNFQWLETTIKSGKFHDKTWGTGVANQWLTELLGFKERWTNAASGDPEGNNVNHQNTIDAAEAAIKQAKDQYARLMALFAKKEMNARGKRKSEDGIDTSRLSNANKKALREFNAGKQKAGNKFQLDTRNTKREASHNYIKREEEMKNEIKLLEVELAKKLFDLEKQYSTANAGGAGVKYWLNSGGHVPFSLGAIKGKDSVRAMLTPGEFVIREGVVRKFGKSFFDKLNNFQIPKLHLAEGGMVPGVSLSESFSKATEEYLGRIDLGINGKKIPVKADLNLARELVKEFRKMGLSLA